MAEETKKTNSPEAEAENENKDGNKGGNKLKTPGKIFLIVFILAAQVLLAYTFVDSSYEKIYGFVQSISSDESVFYEMEELIVNPAGTNGQRFLVVGISLELSNNKHLGLVRQHEHGIRHNMNEALSSRTVSQLAQFEEREKLRYELAGIVNNAIGERSVRNLYYTRYVMQ